MIRKSAMILIIILLLGISGATFASDEEAFVASFPIILNGAVIDNAHAEYPLIVYRNVTYLPMTWDYSTGLGLSAVYSESEGLKINKTGRIEALKQTLTGSNDSSVPVRFDMPFFGIEVNGKYIDNSKEPYPIIMYRGITYFPLTWHFVVDEFGWSSDYSEQSGLQIISKESISEVPGISDEKVTTKQEENRSDKDESSDDLLTAIEIGELSESVVKLYIETRSGAFNTGSGFYYDKGKIATNYHVIENARIIEVEHDDGSIYSGNVKILGFDADKDLAAIQIDRMDIEPMDLGTYTSMVQGQKIYTIGSPHGYMNTLSDGLVSSIRSNIIQITAPISPGSSGGALIDEYGKVVGVTTAISENGENIGFCVPIDEFISMDKTGEVALTRPVYEGVSAPSYVDVEILTNTSFNVIWEDTGADYYVVWESINGGEWQESINQDGENKWYWYPDYCINYYGYTSGSYMSITVASVKDGVMSEYSEVATVVLPYIEASNVEALLNRDYDLLAIGDYLLEIESYNVEIDQSEAYIYIYGYIDAENTYVYADAQQAAYYDMLSTLSGVAAEISSRTGIETIYTLLYSGYEYDYPVQFETNSIYPSTIQYDSETDAWFIWFPYLEISSEYLSDGYSYRFWYE